MFKIRRSAIISNKTDEDVVEQRKSDSISKIGYI